MLWWFSRFPLFHYFASESSTCQPVTTTLFLFLIELCPRSESRRMLRRTYFQKELSELSTGLDDASAPRSRLPCSLDSPFPWQLLSASSLYQMTISSNWRDVDRRWCGRGWRAAETLAWLAFAEGLGRAARAPLCLPSIQARSRYRPGRSREAAVPCKSNKCPIQQD